MPLQVNLNGLSKPVYPGLPDEFIISDNSLGIFDNGCKRKFEFLKLYVTTRGDNSTAGDVGNAMHKAWQNYLLYGDVDKAILTLVLNYPVINNKDLFVIGHHYSIESCIATLLRIFSKANLMEYEIVLIDCIDGIRRPAIEVEFEILFVQENGNPVLINNRRLIYQGFIDAVMFNKLTGDYVAFDLKTHRDKLKDLTGKYLFKGQGIPYGLVIHQITAGKVFGFEIGYVAAYMDLTIDRIQIYKFSKNETDVRDWFTGLCASVKQIKNFSERGWFPRTKNGCLFWGKPCYFLGVCHSRDREQIQKYLVSSFDTPYVPRPRNPWISLQMVIPEEFLI